MNRVAAVVLILVATAGVAAPALSPNPPTEQYHDYLFAPPMRIRVVDRDGAIRAPFVYPIRLVDRLERRYEESGSPVTLQWFTNGRLLSLPAGVGSPLFLLGADSLGRDVFARVLHGARMSLSLAAAAAALTLLIGAAVGSIAGAAGGMTDEILMRAADFVLVLPALYLVLALRAAMPLVLSPGAVFGLVLAILALIGWPTVARGVRAIVAGERVQDYASAAIASGCGTARLLWRHLAPATFGFLAVQGTILLPAYVLAEATLSYLGLGFPEPIPTWGSMLREAADARAVTEYPWLLAPACAIVMVVLCVNIVVGHRRFADYSRLT